MVLGWLCYGLRSSEASAMERHNDEETEMSYGETEMRDKDKIIFFFFYNTATVQSTFRIAL